MNSLLLNLRAAMSRVAGFFVSAWKPIVGVLVGLVALTGVAYVFVPAPTAHGALKGHTVEIYRNAQFQIVFSERMVHSSVENAFHVTPAVEGAFSWKDNMVMFTPKDVLEKGKVYEVTIGASARSIWQKPLAEAFRQSFSVLDYPEVVVTAPTDQSTIMQDQILTVLFDHPIHILTKDAKAPEMLKIDPPVAGDYRWLGTSGFEFVPTNGWPAATEFTVTVPKGTKTADGGSTVEDKTWSFKTPSLAVSWMTQRKHHQPKEAAVFEFNYPVKPEEVRKGMTIKNSAGAMDVSAFSFTADAKRPERMLVLKNGGYDLGETYTFSLTKGFTGNVGKLGLRADVNVVLVMDERTMKVTAVCPDDKGTKEVSRDVVIAFNNPVDEKSLKDAIRVTPAIDEMQITMNGWSDDARCRTNYGDDLMIAVSGSWKPSTAYTIEIKGNIVDIYGHRVESPPTVHITTNPYQPSAMVSSYSSFGVLASHLPRLYQVRTMNMTQPISVQLCPMSFDAYRKESDPSCSSGVTKTFDPTNALNKYKVIDLDLDEIAGSPLALGAYAMTVTIPGERSTYSQTQRRTVLITDTALTLKRDNTGKVVVWATDMKTGNPVAGLDVDLWYTGSRNGVSMTSEAVGSGKTDKDGLLIVKSPLENANGSLAARAQGNGHFGYVATYWEDGISPWNYGLNLRYAHPPAYHIGYLYTDRLIYRPDQLVHFKGVVRLDTDAVLSLPTKKEVTIVIRNQDGNEVSSQTLPLSSYGSFHGDVQLDPSMQLGTYAMEARVADEAAAAPSIVGSFDVREYRRPDFKVEVSSPTGPVTTGDQINIPIHAEYYHGVALAGATASVQVTRTKLYFQPLAGEWYHYGADESMSDCYWYCRPEGQFETVLTQDVVLDGQGNAVIRVPASLTDYKSSATYVVNVTVVDTNRRSVSGNVEFPVHKGLFYMGIRANYDAGWSSDRADFDLVSIETNGAPKANITGTVTFSKRTWTNTKKENPDGSTTWEWTPTDEKVASQSVTTDANGKAAVSFTPPGSGEFVAMVETKDERGNTIAASAERYIYRGDYSYNRVSDDHMMQIVQNKASYNVGETASLAVQTPYASSKALVTVERDTIRDVRVVTLGKDARIVDVPITETSVPNVYVSVLTTATGEKSIPEFRLGYANLQVNTHQRVLDLSVTPNKPTAKPGERVTLTIRATTKDGKPADAEVSVAVVDERVVALLGSIDKNILGKFWFPRDIGVTTAQTLTMLVKKIFFATTDGGAGGKGDGGAPTVRGNFQDTAYWNATVETGADGTAQVSFDLPDNLTSWQILAIGATKKTEVGSAESKIVTRRDLMVEPLMPRILRYNDTAQVGATVFNATDKQISANVTIEAQGVQLEKETSRTISIAPNARVPLSWKVTVPKGGTRASFNVTANGSGLSDGFTVSIPVLSYTVPELVTASGMFEKTATEKLEMPEDAIPAASEVKVSVEPNIGNGLQNGMDYLVQYPYGCAEQKTSALLGNLIYTELTTLKVTKGDDAAVANAKKNVEDAIKLILPMQREDGGFGFWPESGQSYPYLTAYVAWGLTQAQKAGFSVDDQVMDRVDAFLENYLRRNLSDQSNTFWDNERAQVLFMLSERRTDGLTGYADALYERRDGLSSFGRAFLAMAYGNIQKNTSSVRGTRLMDDLQNAFVYLNPTTAYVKEDEGYDYFMSTDLRSTSVALQALLRLAPKSNNIEPLVRYLIQNREDGYWGTTQNTAMSLLALAQYVEANPINDQAASVQVYLDNGLKKQLDFPKGDLSGGSTTIFPGSDLIGKGSIHEVGLEKYTDTRWFYDITMKTTRDIVDIQPFDNGFTITSEVYALTDTKSQHPLSEAKQGENVRVRLKLLVPKRHRYVALESHLPAGLEAVDFSLKTSPKELAGMTEQCAPTYWGGQQCLSDWQYDWWWENVWKHIEQRDDRVFLFSEDLMPGVYEYEYLATAVTQGTFRVPPVRVYEFYNPLANAHNEGKVFVIR